MIPHLAMSRLRCPTFLFALSLAIAGECVAEIDLGRGVRLSLGYTGEVFGNPIGGARRGAVYDGLVELGLNADLEKLAGWTGARFHADGYYPHGVSGSDRFVGDLGEFSNIAFYDSPRLNELWLEQSLFGGAVSLRIGQITFDAEFGGSDTAAIFVSSAFGVSTGVSGNVPAPIYAIAAPGVRLRLEPAPWCCAQFAAFDGNPAPAVLGDPSPDAAATNEFNRSSTQWALRGEEGALLAAEIGFRFNQPEPADGKATRPPRGLAAAFKAGFVYHTDTFSDIGDATLTGLGSRRAPAAIRAERGHWLNNGVADGEVRREPGSDSQGLAVFARGYFAPPDRNYFSVAWDIGARYTGLLPGRDEDALALGCACYHISPRVAGATRAANRADGTRLAIPDYEAVIELTYSARITPWLAVQPDVQWIIHPGGSSAIDDALVVGLRATVEF